MGECEALDPRWKRFGSAHKYACWETHRYFYTIRNGAACFDDKFKMLESL